MSSAIGFIEEPLLRFKSDQVLSNPKDGLFLFGPPDTGNQPRRIRLGALGTPRSINLLRGWLARIKSHIAAPKVSANHMPFPGFEEAFNADVELVEAARLTVDEIQLSRAIRQTLRHKAVRDAVRLYEAPLEKFQKEESENVDVWVVLIPDEIYRYGRSKSVVPKNERIEANYSLSRREAIKILTSQPSLFSEDNKNAELFLFEPNFHHQLKACMLKYAAVVQIIRESTIAPSDPDDPRLRQDDASVAWNLSTTVFYKAGGLPWSLARMRDGVCYLGLVFKKEEVGSAKSNACCGAQMFLDSGESLVFKGTGSEIVERGRNDFHLTKQGARDLLSRVVEHYKTKSQRTPVKLFLHGRTYFSDEEWNGFRDAVDTSTELVGVRIRPASDFKLYGPTTTPVLRGTYVAESATKGYLWTRGYVPRLQTYPGREVPNPLLAQIVRGKCDLKEVLEDLLGLTKVNYNACIFADGLPVTLRFANAVGEILTAAPSSVTDRAPWPFKHYI